MGCANTKMDQVNCLFPEDKKPLAIAADPEVLKRKRNEFHEQYHKLLNRISDYEKESQDFLENLYMEPQCLLPEDLRYGYISANSFFNLFHAGFCAPYISNPNYLLLVDFRSQEEFEEKIILTAVHFETLSWDMIEYPDICSYSMIVFYDHDGTSAANVYSIVYRAFAALKRKRIECFCILGGIKQVEEKFPHLISYKNSNSTDFPNKNVIPWMPTLVKCDSLFLGRHEQAEERKVIDGLGITHILSIGRSPESRFEGVYYFGLDGERSLLSAFEAAFTILSSVIKTKNCRILVHGVEGLNRSAAIIIAFLMKFVPCTLEDAFFYTQVLRPFIRLDDECMECLLRYEKRLFGSYVTDLEELWI